MKISQHHDCLLYMKVLCLAAFTVKVYCGSFRLRKYIRFISAAHAFIGIDKNYTYSQIVGTSLVKFNNAGGYM